MTDEESIRKNNLELAAWDEWKITCSVNRCGPEKAKALKERLYHSACRKLNALLASCYPNWLDYEQTSGLDLDDHEDKTLTRDERWREIFAEVFDRGIEEKANGQTKRQVKKCYKSDTWLKVQGSPDDPLKIIRGQFTAKHGIFNEFIERWVLPHMGIGVKKGEKDAGRTLTYTITRTQSGCARTPKSEKVHTGSHYGVLPNSLDVKVGNVEDSDDSSSLLDLLPDESVREKDLPANEIRLIHDLVAGMSPQEIVFVLAESFKISYAEPSVCEALGGVGKSKAYQLVKEIEEGKNPMVQLRNVMGPICSDYSPLQVMSTLHRELKVRLGLEKSAAAFLKRVVETEAELARKNLNRV